MKRGAPVLVTLGIQEDSNQNLVVNVIERMDGCEWECTHQQFGIISYISDDYENVKVFLSKDKELKLDQNILRDLKNKISIGSKLKCFSTINAKSQRIEISHVELVNSAQITDMKEELFLDHSVYERWYGGDHGGLHRVYVAEIVDAWVKE